MHIIAHQGIYDIYNFKEEKNMICPKCGSQNVNVQMIQTGGKTKKKGKEGKKPCLFGLEY